MPSVDAFVDGLGGLVIGLAAAVAGGIAHARNSPTAIATLVICGLILSPFFIVATLTLCFGLACCVPIAVAGIVIAWLPSWLRNVGAVLSNVRHVIATFWSNLFGLEAVQSAGEMAQANPLLAAGAIGCALMLLPPALFVLGVAVFFFLLFAPLTVPATAYVCWLAMGRPADEAATMTPSSQAPLPPRDTPTSAPPATRLPPSVGAAAGENRAPQAGSIPRANSKQGLFHAARAPSEASSAAA